MLLPIFVLLVLVSCSKSGTTDDDYDAPVVVLTTPVNDQTVAGGSMIHIAGTVTDNRYIKEIHVVINNYDTGEEYLHIHIHPASASATFDQTYLIAAGTSYQIRVIGDDAASNSAVQQVKVTGN